MKKTFLITAFLSFGCITLFSQTVEPLPFGDFEHWVVRNFKESAIIGGSKKTIYAVGPTDTINENAVFQYGKNGNPWSISNAYAVVSGIHKASGTVVPEKRGNGYCARMDVKMETVTALGFIDVRVLVNGTIFTGKTIEPIKTAKDPYQNIDFGVPFTRRPKALMFDYKAVVSDEQWVWQAKGLGRPKKIAGHDECAAFLFLQKRWEDKDGNIHAKRVGTAYERYTKTQPTWVNNHQIPIRYGDITKQPGYESYMGLTNQMRALNSKGKIVPIEEEGWADASETPTHMIIMLSSGIYEAFIGHEGNVFWIDNVKLVY